MIKRHIFYVLVENRSGVLARVTGLFSARGFNIESLTVAETQDPKMSRMTIVVPGDEKILDQVRKQMGKLIEVHEAHDFSVEGKELVNREIILCKVAATPEKRPEIIQIANIFRARVADVGPESIIFEATGNEDKMNAFIKLLEPYNLLEVARGGRVAMARGKQETPMPAELATAS